MPKSKKIILICKPADDTIEKKYFSKENSRKIMNWDNIGDESDFLLGPVAPLVPNRNYIFTFKSFQKWGVTDAQKVELKLKIFEKIKEATKNPNEISQNTINNLNNDLNNIPESLFGIKKFIGLDEQEIKISSTKGALGNYTNELIELSSDINTKNDDIKNFKEDYKNFFSILAPILKSVKDTMKLTKETKLLLENPVDVSIPEIGKTKLKNAFLFIETISENSNHFESFIDGKLKTNGQELIITNTFDENSIKYIISCLSILKTNNKFSSILKESEKNEIEKLISNFLLLIQSYQVIANNKNSIEDIKNKIPDLLSNTFINSIYNIETSSQIDVISDRTPYISLDFGISNSFNGIKKDGNISGNNVYFFTYQSANIHFLPVNKRVLTNSFKGKYRFFKNFSFQIGLAQLLGNYNNDRFSNSLGTAGNFLIGAGYRINRVAKIGISSIFINRKDLNSPLTITKLSPLFGVNFSFDINIARAFGSIGTALKLF